MPNCHPMVCCVCVCVCCTVCVWSRCVRGFQIHARVTTFGTVAFCASVCDQVCVYTVCTLCVGWLWAVCVGPAQFFKVRWLTFWFCPPLTLWCVCVCIAHCHIIIRNEWTSLSVYTFDHALDCTRVVASVLL